MAGSALVQGNTVYPNRQGLSEIMSQVGSVGTYPRPLHLQWEAATPGGTSLF